MTRAASWGRGGDGPTLSPIITSPASQLWEPGDDLSASTTALTWAKAQLSPVHRSYYSSRLFLSRESKEECP